MNTTKKCPLCAEEIPLAAVTCEYCGAQFEVTSSGYCQNCHQVREADENGQCKVCGNKVMDLRVESKLIEGSVQEPLPVSPPTTQTEIPKTGKSRLPIGILAGILIFAIIGAVLWLGRKSIPAVSSLLATSTPTATMTFTPTLASTAASTRTPRPIPTATPLPTWVTEFAEPILSAIAGRPPTIQDDLHDKSGGWRLANWCSTSATKYYVDGELVLDFCEATRSKMAYTDFVLELDARFLPDTDTDSNWVVFFRDTGTGPSYSFGVDYAGTFWVFKNEPDEPVGIEPDGRVHPGTEANHILLIAKGPRFAFYVNGQPIYYWEDATLSQRGSISFRTGIHGRSHNLNDHSIAAFDNLKIWDISDLP